MKRIAEKPPLRADRPSEPEGLKGPISRHNLAFSLSMYVIVAILANWNVWVHGFAHSLQASGGSDISEEIWFLAQTPWAIVHGVSPFANNWLNAPTGLDLMDNTTMPLLGVLGAPITFLFGPIATFNVMMALGFAGSATAFFLMARRFVRWWPTAFFGGLLYGFSPFAVAEGIGHMFIVYGAIPPLVVLVIDGFLRAECRSPGRYGLALGGCFIAQFYISTEAFASLVVMSLISGVLAFLVLGRQREIDLLRLAKMCCIGIAVATLGVGYGAWVALGGPQHITGPAQTATAIAGLSGDPVGLVVPTSNQHFTLGHAGLGDSLVSVRSADWSISFEAPAENGTYVGIPLLLILLAGTILLRRKPLAVFCAMAALVAIVISMGQYLHVDGHRTALPLPFIVLAHLPLLDSGIASRYATFFWLFAALLLALIVDEMHGKVSQTARVRAAFLSFALFGVALLPLVPAWPYAFANAAVPAWFTDAGRSLPLGSTVVVYPYPSAIDSSAMLWQAMSDLSFRMPGGYAVFATPAGSASFYGMPTALQGALSACESGQEPQLPPQVVRSDLGLLKATKVVVAHASSGARCAIRLFTSSLGPPSTIDGVSVWTTPGSHRSR
jgi:hypothetical protein